MGPVTALGQSHHPIPTWKFMGLENQPFIFFKKTNYLLYYVSSAVLNSRKYPPHLPTLGELVYESYYIIISFELKGNTNAFNAVFGISIATPAWLGVDHHV